MGQIDKLLRRLKKFRSNAQTHTCRHTCGEKYKAIERAPRPVMGGCGARVTVLPNCPPGSRGQSTIMAVINITIRKQDPAGGLEWTDGGWRGEEMKNSADREWNEWICTA